MRQVMRDKASNAEARFAEYRKDAVDTARMNKMSVLIDDGVNFKAESVLPFCVIECYAPGKIGNPAFVYRYFNDDRSEVIYIVKDDGVRRPLPPDVEYFD